MRTALAPLQCDTSECDPADLNAATGGSALGDRPRDRTSEEHHAISHNNAPDAPGLPKRKTHNRIVSFRVLTPRTATGLGCGPRNKKNRPNRHEISRGGGPGAADAAPSPARRRAPAQRQRTRRLGAPSSDSRRVHRRGRHRSRATPAPPIPLTHRTRPSSAREPLPRSSAHSACPHGRRRQHVGTCGQRSPQGRAPACCSG